MMKIVCSSCHLAFDYVKLVKGRLPKYCDNCRKEANKAYVKKWKDKKKAKSITKKWNEKPKVEQPQVTTQVVEVNDVREFRADQSVVPYVPYVEELTSIAQKLVSIKQDVKALSSKISSEQSVADKEDTTFLHIIETLDRFNGHEAFDLLKREKEKRVARRDCKVIGQLLFQISSGIPENALQIVVEGIKKNNETREQFKRDINEVR